MKKHPISLAVTAALLGGAVSAHSAMYVNDRGFGEALVYPFYSAANGNDTYIHIVNTTTLTKAVKVRFIEAQNSQEVLDFNLYLSPNDEWAGAITKNPNGEGAIIRTVDNSCTVPELGIAVGGNTGPYAGTKTEVNGKIVRDQPFVPFKYKSDLDNGDDRTLQGYVEMIEMGQLAATQPPGFFGWTETQLNAWLADDTTGKGWAAVHNENGVPYGCQKLVKAWNASIPGVWAGNSGDPQQELLTWNGGGLYGIGMLINVEDGTAAGMDATAIAEFVNSDFPDPIHFAPGDDKPSFENAQPTATIFNNGTANDYDFVNGVDATSALFMTETLSDDYVTDPGINALTDWIITMPTKHFYTTGSPARPPFTDYWHRQPTSADREKACETVEIETWDREEAFVPPPTDGFSPRPDPESDTGFQLCTESSVISFGTESAVHATDATLYGFNGELAYPDGWARLSFDTDSSLDDLNGNSFAGLPAIGLAVFKYTNGTLEGGTVLSNYAASSEIKTEAVISSE